MARIDHTGHNHPATPAGRAACRKSGTPPVVVLTPVTVDEIHCSECGRTPEGDASDGYSGCCNEPLVSDCRPYANGGSCHHN